MERDKLLGSNKQETMDISPNEDKDLATIRYFHSNFENFFNYWKKRGVKVDPYEETEMIHPYKGAKSNSKLPIQDFHTYDKSDMNDKITESFNQFMDEINESDE
jgi:hypothetical protein